MAHCIRHLWIDKKNQQKYDPIPQKFSWRKKGPPSTNVGHLSELEMMPTIKKSATQEKVKPIIVNIGIKEKIWFRELSISSRDKVMPRQRRTVSRRKT
jgi:hypothetical protein